MGWGERDGEGGEGYSGRGGADGSREQAAGIQPSLKFAQSCDILAVKRTCCASEVLKHGPTQLHLAPMHVLRYRYVSPVATAAPACTATRWRRLVAKFYQRF